MPPDTSGTFNVRAMLRAWCLFALLLCASAALLPTTAHADITTGLVGRWTFDEGTGPTAADSSGGGSTGTLNGGAAWIAGHIGAGAISLDGNNNTVSIANQTPSICTLDEGKGKNWEGKCVPLLGFETWCEGHEENALVQSVIGLTRCKPEHPAPLMSFASP